MQVWQHLNDMDHLRRRAEGMIKAARGGTAASAASNGHRPSAKDAHKLDMKDGLQNTPALSDMSGMSDK
ncbi:MAG TPA: hypothetical protein VIN57_01745 [Magnetovibrio sp.]